MAVASNLSLCARALVSPRRRANSLLQSNDFAYSEALTTSPNISNLYILRGKSLANYRRLSEAIQDFQSASVFDNSNPDAFLVKASVLNHAKQHYDAGSTLIDGLKCAPADALLSLALDDTLDQIRRNRPHHSLSPRKRGTPTYDFSVPHDDAFPPVVASTVVKAEVEERMEEGWELVLERLKDVISPTELLRIRRIVQDHLPAMTAIFNHYRSRCYDPPGRLSFQAMSHFMKDCRIPAHGLPIAVINRLLCKLLTECNAFMSLPNFSDKVLDIHAPNNTTDIFCWIEVLIRIALVKFGSSPLPSDRLKRLLTANILPFACRDGCHFDEYTRSFWRCTGIHDTLRMYMPQLEKTFRHFVSKATVSSNAFSRVGPDVSRTVRTLPLGISASASANQSQGQGQGHEEDKDSEEDSIVLTLPSVPNRPLSPRPSPPPSSLLPPIPGAHISPRPSSVLTKAEPPSSNDKLLSPRASNSPSPRLRRLSIASSNASSPSARAPKSTSPSLADLSPLPLSELSELGDPSTELSMSRVNGGQGQGQRYAWGSGGKGKTAVSMSISLGSDMHPPAPASLSPSTLTSPQVSPLSSPRRLSLAAPSPTPTRTLAPDSPSDTRGPSLTMPLPSLNTNTHSVEWTKLQAATMLMRAKGRRKSGDSASASAWAQPLDLTMSFNAFLRTITDLGLMDHNLNTKTVTDAFCLVTGDEKIAPQEHNHNANSEMTYNEFCHALFRVYRLKHANNLQPSDRDLEEQFLHFIADVVLPAADRVFPGALM